MSTRKHSINPDLITGALLLILGLGLFWACMSVKDFAAIGVGSAFVPRLTAGLLTLVSLVLLANGFRARSTDELEIAASPENAVFGGLPAVATSVALMIGYLALLEPLGFLPASVLYVFAQMLVLRKHAADRYVLFGVTTVLAAVACNYLFVNLFDISLPQGILG